MITFRTRASRVLSYRRSGEGPLVVMLPGGPGLDPETYFANSGLRGLSQLVLCPRGTGGSDAPPTPDGYRMAGYVEDVEELRLHLGVPELRLYGSSHGASTALAYAGAYPDRVARLVAVNGPARVDAAFMAALANARKRFVASSADSADRLRAADDAFAVMRTTADDDTRRIAFHTVLNRYVARLGDHEIAFLDQLCAAPMNFGAAGPMGAEMVGGLDLLQNATAITARTLIVGSELDTQVPAEHMRKVADRIPGADFVQFDDTGHFVEVEETARWAELVGNFFRG
ncbi:MAG: alpha/beta fold hydrolase [Nakamurella sp.]